MWSVSGAGPAGRRVLAGLSFPVTPSVSEPLQPRERAHVRAPEAGGSGDSTDGIREQTKCHPLFTNHMLIISSYSHSLELEVRTDRSTL